MRRIVAISLAIAFVLSVTTPVYSHQPSQLRNVREEIATRVAEKKSEIEARKEEVKQRVATRIAEVKAKVIERIKNVFDRILDRFAAALGRLDKIVARIESRIDKLAAGGVDTAAAAAALVDCEAEKAAAQGAIEDAKAAIDAIDLASVNVRGAVQTSVAEVRSGKRTLQAYHKCLVNVNRTLKASIPKEATESAE